MTIPDPAAAPRRPERGVSRTPIEVLGAFIDRHDAARRMQEA
jgi:hypothetical protein